MISTYRMELTTDSDVLEPPVASLLGALSVDVARTLMRSMVMPSAYAHAWAAFVWIPCRNYEYELVVVSHTSRNLAK